MTAYYNEFDPFAAAWLRNLITAGHIAPGDVDERSIEDVSPDDLRPYTQCHFFAGIGVWSYALRRAGWPDDEPIWTGSCPCQPFSAAGKGGGFADERHLWPAFFHLIGECDPSIVIGEQVASKDGLAWLDLVRADLEASGRAVAAVDMCAAGVGAPHIRQRTFWMADASGKRRDGVDARIRPEDERRSAAQTILESTGRGGAMRLAHADGESGGTGFRDGQPTEHGGAAVADRGGDGGVADDTLRGRREERTHGSGQYVGNSTQGRAAGLVDGIGSSDPSPTNGFWRDADWLYCRDGKWRPVEPGTFPLAYGSANRVGRLRGYGNAIVAPVAETFIRAVIEARRGAALLA